MSEVDEHYAVCETAVRDLTAKHTWLASLKPAEHAYVIFSVQDYMNRIIKMCSVWNEPARRDAVNWIFHFVRNVERMGLIHVDPDAYAQLIVDAMIVNSVSLGQPIANA